MNLESIINFATQAKEGTSGIIEESLDIKKRQAEVEAEIKSLLERQKQLLEEEQTVAQQFTELTHQLCSAISTESTLCQAPQDIQLNHIEPTISFLELTDDERAFVNNLSASIIDPDAPQLTVQFQSSESKGKVGHFMTFRSKTEPGHMIHFILQEDRFNGLTCRIQLPWHSRKQDTLLTTIQEQNNSHSLYNRVRIMSTFFIAAHTSLHR